MSKILLKGRPYGGSTTVTDALHLLTKDTLNADVSAQNMLTNILGDMAQLETSTAATKAYAKGEYLVLGSYFYKVTATIDPGDTLTVGTNIERTNVGAEVSELNSNRLLTKTVDLTNQQLGSSWSQTSKTIGKAIDLFGISADKIVSCIMAEAEFTPSANSMIGFYNGYVWVAASQSSTLSSGGKFKIVYTL